MDTFGHKKLVYILISVVAIISVSIGVVFALRLIAPKTVQKNTAVAAAECPTGFIIVPGNQKYNTKDFCVMKYEAKFVNGVPTSQVDNTPWVDIPQIYAVDVSKRACDGCHLITENEWLTIAQNIMSVPSNWSLNVVGGGYIYSGHNDGSPAKTLVANTKDAASYSEIGDPEPKEITSDSAQNSQRRTLKLSNGQIIWDFSGNIAEWTAGQTTGGQPGLKDESSYAWKEWNSVNFNGYLAVKPMPGYGNNSASVWNSQQGLGQLYSNVSDDKLRGFVRGGSYTQGAKAGIFSLDLSNSPTDSSSSIGFRVAK